MLITKGASACGVLLVAVLLLLACGSEDSSSGPSSPAPSVNSTWQTFRGGAASDIAEAVIATPDGGCIVGGLTSSFNAAGWDIYLVRFDGDGRLVWEQVYGTAGDDAVFAITAATDGGGYVMAGRQGSDVYLFKIDDGGSVLWQKTYGGSGVEEGRAVAPMADGGYIVVGWTDSYGAGGQDIYLLKVDHTGELVWQNTLGGSGGEQARDVIELEDGFLVVGWTTSFGSGAQDVYLARTDDVGELVRESSFGGSGSDEARALAPTSDGGCIIVGWTESIGAGQVDMYLILVDSSGSSVRQKVFGGVSDDYGWSLTAVPGGHILAGWTHSWGSGDDDVFLVKVDQNQTALWQRSYGSLGRDRCYAMAPAVDGGLFLAGVTTSFTAAGTDLYVLKTDASGNTGELVD